MESHLPLSDSAEKPVRDSAGRWLPGCPPGPGRPPGIPTRPDLARLAVERGHERGVDLEEALLDLLQRLVELGRAGDVHAIRVLLQQVCAAPPKVAVAVGLGAGTLEDLVVRSLTHETQEEDE